MVPPEVMPHQLAAAAVLITDSSGRALLVATHNRDALVLPGGMVESGESPAAAAEREVLEEIGLGLQVTRLLAVQHKPARQEKPASLMFIFDTRPVQGNPQFRLQPEEICDTFWLEPAAAVQRHTSGGQARLAAAFMARREGLTVYMDAERELVFGSATHSG